MTSVVGKHSKINGSIDIAAPAVGILPGPVAQAPHIVAPGRISGIVQVVHRNPGPGLADRGADVVLLVIGQASIDPVVGVTQRTQGLEKDVQVIYNPRVPCLRNILHVGNHQGVIA